jgi:hypothetical protein
MVVPSIVDIVPGIVIVVMTTMTIASIHRSHAHDQQEHQNSNTSARHSHDSPNLATTDPKAGSLQGTRAGSDLSS